MASQGLLPLELRRSLQKTSRSECVELFGDSVLLLVRVDDRSPDLLRGLNESSGLDGDDVFPSTEIEGAATMTAAIDLDAMLREPPSRAPLDARALGRSFRSEAYFIAPLRRRRMPDRPVLQQISIGRGEYNDIVLLDPSVSNMHGWLERDESGQFYLSDARSRNTTRVNDVILHGGSPVKLGEGDEIWFGSVKVLVTHPRTLWDALRVR